MILLLHFTFHLSNGAGLERVNTFGNLRPYGLPASIGVTVNYRYLPDELEENHERFVRGESQVANELLAEYTSVAKSWQRRNGNSYTVYDPAKKDCSEPSVTPQNSVARFWEERIAEAHGEFRNVQIPTDVRACRDMVVVPRPKASAVGPAYRSR